jgi:hypothetical protein
MPCSEKRARLLLTRGRAVVHRRYPFTIRLKDCVGGDVQPVRVKIDPGTETTASRSSPRRTATSRRKPSVCLSSFTGDGSYGSPGVSAATKHRGLITAPMRRLARAGWPVVALDTRPGALRRARSV